MYRYHDEVIEENRIGQEWKHINNTCTLPWFPLHSENINCPADYTWQFWRLQHIEYTQHVIVKEN